MLLMFAGLLGTLNIDYSQQFRRTSMQTCVGHDDMI